METVNLEPASVIEIPALGFGNEQSSISIVKQRASGELRGDIEAAAADLILSRSCIVPVTERDDGCIDGRSAESVVFYDSLGNLQSQKIHETRSINERYKVAGGGYITGLAMSCALRVPRDGIDNALNDLIIQLSEQHVYCGAHVGSHADTTKTDCGACDKFEIILNTAVQYRQQIETSVEALLELAGAAYDQQLQDTIIEGWSLLADTTANSSISSGAAKYKIILDGFKANALALHTDKPLNASKALQGEHNEDFIVVQLAEGKTFSQAIFRQQLQAQFPNLPSQQLAQAFVVDVPRIAQLAGALTDGDSEVQLALQAGVTYQLATAATLTDGTLRTFVSS